MTTNPRLWEIETHVRPGVFHLAPEGTAAPICDTAPRAPANWRTPPSLIKGHRLCANCDTLVRARLRRSLSALIGAS